MKCEFIHVPGGLVMRAERLTCTEEESERFENAGIEPDWKWTPTTVDLSMRVPVQWEQDDDRPECAVVWYEDGGQHVLNMSIEVFDREYMRYLSMRSVLAAN